MLLRRLLSGGAVRRVACVRVAVRTLATTAVRDTVPPMPSARPADPIAVAHAAAAAAAAARERDARARARHDRDVKTERDYSVAALKAVRAAVPNGLPAVHRALDAYEQLVKTGRCQRLALPYNTAISAIAAERRNARHTSVNRRDTALVAAAGSVSAAAIAAAPKALDPSPWAQPATAYVLAIVSIWERLHPAAAQTAAQTAADADAKGDVVAGALPPIVTNVSERVLMTALELSRGQQWMRDAIVRYRASVPREPTATEVLSAQQLTALSDFMEFLRVRCVAARVEVTQERAAHDAAYRAMRAAEFKSKSHAPESGPF